MHTCCPTNWRSASNAPSPVSNLRTRATRISQEGSFNSTFWQTRRQELACLSTHFKTSEWVDRSGPPILDYQVQSVVPDTALVHTHSKSEERQLEKVLVGDTAPSLELYRSLLRDCSKTRDLDRAKKVHSHLAHHGFETTGYLGESVVNTLVRCGSLEDALHVFQKLPNRTVVSWTAVISAFTNAGKCREALRMYHLMVEEDVAPNSYTFVSLVKACGSIPDLGEGKRMHAEATNYGCDSNLFVATSLVDMYAKCGSMPDALHIFKTLAHRDVVSWTAMIAGYMHQGQGKDALLLYEQMQEECVRANNWTYVALMQACSYIADTEDIVAFGQQSLKVESWQLGKAVHAEIQGRGYALDEYVGNALITMYSRCGSLMDARVVFDALCQRVVVSWNAMLAAYAQGEFAEEALELYGQMMQEGPSPNSRSFVSVLQACTSLAEKEEFVSVEGLPLRSEWLHVARCIHAEAARRGFDLDVFVNSTLVGMYATCGSIADAQSTFDRMSHYDVVSWNSLMVAHAQQGKLQKVLQVYVAMVEEDTSPDVRSIVTVLQACGAVEQGGEYTVAEDQTLPVDHLQLGKALHAEAWSRGYRTNTFIRSGLISLYGKSGSVLDAQNVFEEEVSDLDVMSANAMLGVYAQQQEPDKVFQLYGHMLEVGLIPDDRTFVSLLQAYVTLTEKEAPVVVNGILTKVESFKKGKVIQSEGWARGYRSNLFLVSSLISFYAKSGSIADSEVIFGGVSQRDVILWNTMIAAYCQQGQADKALQVYSQMVEDGLHADGRTFASLFQACGMLAENEEHISDEVNDEGSCPEVALHIGKLLHSEASKGGYCCNVYVRSSLISMYGKCMSSGDAEIIFYDLYRSSVVLWNAMLAAYLHCGQPEKAWRLYERLQVEGVSPDDRTFVTALQACGMLAQNEEKGTSQQVCKAELLQKGEAVHHEAWEAGYESDTFVANALISMYGKVGSLAAAQNVFDGLLQRDVVSWNALLANYIQQRQPDKALQVYEQMQSEGASPNEVTFVCTLQACCTTGSLDICVGIHHNMVSKGMDLSTLLAHTLIHAYGRCASMAEAQKVFDSLLVPTVISWNALIAGHSRQGNWEGTLRCYEEMLLSGVEPDGVTFLSILSLCSHAGFVTQGLEHFESMSRDYGIAPDIHHYASLVDLLGRAGYFTVIEGLLQNMPIQPTWFMWLCLLAACRKHGNVDLGKRAFDMAVSVHPEEAGPYILMSQIYAHADMQDCAMSVNESRQKAGAWKQPGQSWIEHKQEIQTFMVSDRKHTQSQQIYMLLSDLRLQGETQTLLLDPQTKCHVLLEVNTSRKPSTLVPVPLSLYQTL